MLKIPNPNAFADVLVLGLWVCFGFRHSDFGFSRYDVPMESFNVKTHSRDEFIAITPQVRRIVERAGVSNGRVVVYVPHTTAGVTINENADPDVAADIIAQLDKMAPWDQPFYRHAEGNAAAHVKASMMGSSATVLIEDGKLMLGAWQGIFFCEFDGPRHRQVHVKAISDC